MHEFREVGRRNFSVPATTEKVKGAEITVHTVNDSCGSERDGRGEHTLCLLELIDTVNLCYKARVFGGRKRAL